MTSVYWSIFSMLTDGVYMLPVIESSRYIEFARMTENIIELLARHLIISQPIAKFVKAVFDNDHYGTESCKVHRFPLFLTPLSSVFNTEETTF